MAGLSVLSRLAMDFRSGVTSSNWGTWRRDEDYARYYRNTCFWAVVALLWFIFGVLIMIGYTPLPSIWFSRS